MTCIFYILSSSPRYMNFLCIKQTLYFLGFKKFAYIFVVFFFVQNNLTKKGTKVHISVLFSNFWKEKTAFVFPPSPFILQRGFIFYFFFLLLYKTWNRPALFLFFKITLLSNTITLYRPFFQTPKIYIRAVLKFGYVLENYSPLQYLASIAS